MRSLNHTIYTKDHGLKGLQGMNRTQEDVMRVTGTSHLYLHQIEYLLTCTVQTKPRTPHGNLPLVHYPALNSTTMTATRKVDIKKQSFIYKNYTIIEESIMRFLMQCLWLRIQTVTQGNGEGTCDDSRILFLIRMAFYHHIG